MRRQGCLFPKNLSSGEEPRALFSESIPRATKPSPQVARAKTFLLESAPLWRVREAEVGDLDVVVGVQQEVLRLEVTVHDVVIVAVLDTRDDLVEKVPRFVRRQSTYSKTRVDANECARERESKERRDTYSDVPSFVPETRYDTSRAAASVFNPFQVLGFVFLAHKRNVFDERAARAGQSALGDDVVEELAVRDVLHHDENVRGTAKKRQDAAS